MTYFESDIREIKASSTLVGLQSTINSLTNQLKELKQFEREYRQLPFFDKTTLEISDLQKGHELLNK